jgi:hypothetical protein
MFCTREINERKWISFHVTHYFLCHCNTLWNTEPECSSSNTAHLPPWFCKQTQADFAQSSVILFKKFVYYPTRTRFFWMNSECGKLIIPTKICTYFTQIKYLQDYNSLTTLLGQTTYRSHRSNVSKFKAMGGHTLRELHWLYTSDLQHSTCNAIGSRQWPDVFKHPTHQSHDAVLRRNKELNCFYCRSATILSLYPHTT